MSKDMRPISLEESYWLELMDLADAHNTRATSKPHQKCEQQLVAVNALLSKAKEDKNPLAILIIERHSLNWEYDSIEKIHDIDQKVKNSRLTILDNILVQLRNCIKDIELILKNPKQYTKGIQEAYGQHRTILAPPAGDNVRKFVLAQSQRLGRMNQGFRSDQETAFFVARQEALKTLGFVYTQLQCKALGLDAKKAKALSSTSP